MQGSSKLCDYGNVSMKIKVTCMVYGMALLRSGTTTTAQGVHLERQFVASHEISVGAPYWSLVICGCNCP